MATVLDAGFVEVYAKSTGAKQIIPEHWLDHPVLGKDFSRTPSAQARAATADRPSASWTHRQLDTYAADQDPPIDLGDARTVADKVSAIEAAEAARVTRDPDGQPLEVITDPTPTPDQA